MYKAFYYLILVNTCLVYSPHLLSQIYYNNFDGPSPLVGWELFSSAPGISWNTDNSSASTPGLPYYSPPFSLNYNNGTNYNSSSANFGTATSPSIDISNASYPKLKFWCNYHTETTKRTYDKRTVIVLDPTSQHIRQSWQLATIHSEPSKCQPMGTWHQHILPLDPSWKNISIQFKFEADGNADNFSGWFIDNLEVVDEPLAPPAGSLTLPYVNNFASPSGWIFVSTSTTVVWNVDTSPSITYDGTPNLNYNNGTDYNDGTSNSGYALSPLIDVSNATLVHLSFMCYYHTESQREDYDKRFFEIVNPITGETIFSYQLSPTAPPPLKCSSPATWHQHIFYFTPLYKAIKVRFRFSSDNLNNNYPGWFIDNLKIIDNSISIPPGSIPLPFLNNFDGPSPLSGWTSFNSNPPVIWNADALPAISYSAPNSLNYNNNTNYDTSTFNTGYITSPPIDVSTATNLKLYFWCYNDTEKNTIKYDKRSVLIMHPSTEVVITGWHLVCPSTPAWHQHAYFINPGGSPPWKAIRIRFLFDADDTLNSGAGWFIDNLRVIDEIPPSLSNLSQYKADGTTPLPEEGFTNQSTVVFKAFLNDPEPADMLRLQVELKPFATPFDGVTGIYESSPVPVGSTAQVTVSGLADGQYHWRARVIDLAGITSQWIEFGTVGNIDFWKDTTTPSLLDLQQYRSDSTTTIPIGGYTNENLVIFKASVSDPVGKIKLQVEAKQVGFFFLDVPSAEGAFVLSGSSASVVLPIWEGSYHWQARVVDEAGNTSGWISFGANPEIDPDFIVDFSPPSPFTPISPPDQQITFVNAATFEWSESTHISGVTYVLMLSTDPLFPPASTWLYPLPSTSISIDPLPLATSAQYFWQVVAIAGSCSKTETEPQSLLVDLDFPYSTQLLQIPGVSTIPYETYLMISISLIPQPEGLQQLQTVFGEYHPTVWRLFQWRSLNQTYYEFPNIDKFQPGRGYWLITRYPADIIFTGKAITLNKFFIKLRPGWNQIGMPFTQSIPWSSVIVKRKKTDGTDEEFNTSGLNQLIINILYGWENGSYVSSNYLQPNKAYFIKNKTTQIVWLSIPKILPEPSEEPSFTPLPEGAEIPPLPPSGLTSSNQVKDSGRRGCFGMLVIYRSWFWLSILLLTAGLAVMLKFNRRLL